MGQQEIGSSSSHESESGDSDPDTVEDFSDQQSTERAMEQGLLDLSQSNSDRDIPKVAQCEDFPTDTASVAEKNLPSTDVNKTSGQCSGDMDREASAVSKSLSDKEVLVLQQNWEAFKKDYIYPLFESIADEFVNVETFWINMDALLLEMLGHDYLDWTWGGQSLVLVYMVERFLESLWNKDGRFRLVFFDDMEGLYHQAGPEVALMYEVLRCHVASKESLTQLALVFSTPYSKHFVDAIKEYQPSFIFTSSRVSSIENILDNESATRFELCFASIYLRTRLQGIPVAEINGIVQGLSSVMVFYDSYHLDAIDREDFAGLLLDFQPAWHGLRATLDVSITRNAQLQYPSREMPDSATLWVRAIGRVFAADGGDSMVATFRRILLGIVTQYSVPPAMRCQQIQAEWVTLYERAYKPFFVPVMNVMAEELRTSRRSDDNRSPVSHYDLLDGRFLLAMFAHCCSLEEQTQMATLPVKIFDDLAAVCDSLHLPLEGWKRGSGDAEDKIGAGSGDRLAVFMDDVVHFPCLVQCKLIDDVKKSLPSAVLNILEVTTRREETPNNAQSSTGSQLLYFDVLHWHSGKMIVDPLDIKAREPEYTVNPRFSQKGKQRQRLFVHVYGDSIKNSDTSALKPNFADLCAGKKKVTMSLSDAGSKATSGKKGGRRKHSKAGAHRPSAEEIIQHQDLKHQQSEREQLDVVLKEMEEKVAKGAIAKLSAIDQLDRKTKKVKYAANEVILVLKSVQWQLQMLKFETGGPKADLLEARRTRAPKLIHRLRYLLRRNLAFMTAADVQFVLNIWTAMGFPAKVLMGMPHEGGYQGADQGELNLHTDWIDYMFRYGGELMDIQNDPQADQRVDFEPDGWQRELLDAIDSNQSALAIAPTSAGKTFVSYYCIERVLKDNKSVSKEIDLGFVVYVSPTKALVNQVAATIYAKFSDHSSASGYPVYGVLTRDYHINVNRCQVLVTVPQCLDILLMSPSRERWTNQLRFVILDEIHCIGGNYIEGDGGTNVWEHIIKMFPCPFIALSATVGNPQDLYDLLENVENCKIELKIRSTDGHQQSPRVKLVNYSERYSELRHYLFEHPIPQREPKSAEAVATQLKRPSGNVRFHPLSVYTANSLAEFDLPKDQYLTATETIMLYDTMAKVDPEVSQMLSPSNFFGTESWLTRADLRKYENGLKTKLVNWARNNSESGEEKAKADCVLSMLRKNSQQQLDILSRGFGMEKYARTFVIDLVDQLRMSDMLPCLAFGDDRAHCQRLASIVADHLRKQEEEFRNLPANAAKIAEWETLKDRARKDEKRKRDRKHTNCAASKGPDIVAATLLKKHPRNAAEINNWEFAKDRAMKYSQSFADETPHFTVSKTAEDDEDDMLAGISAQFPLDLSNFTLARPGIGGDLLEERKETMYQRGQDSKQLNYCLDRGIGYHHSGMKLSQRQTVEMLFRAGYLGIVFTTSTLALGVHMPCRSVTFTCDSMYLTPLKYRQMAGRAGRRGFDTSGNVIFFALPTRKVSRLLRASLPLLRGSTPFTAGTLLRLLTICDHAKNKSLAVSRARVLLDNHFITYSWNNKLTKSFNRQMQLYVLSCAELLHKMSLVDAEGRPAGFAGVVNHLSYHQPGCFVFVYFLQHGTFHELCQSYSEEEISKTELEETFVLVLSHLFTSAPIIPGFDDFSDRKNSKVLLEEQPEPFVDALEEYNSFVGKWYQAFVALLVNSYQVDPIDDPKGLPITSYPYQCRGTTPDQDDELLATDLGQHLRQNQQAYSLQGYPLGLCGTGGAKLGISRQYIVPPIDERIFVDPTLIPTVPYPRRDHAGRKINLNAYALDFYRHGIWQAIVRDNGLMEGDVFHKIKDFSLVLKSIVEVLKEVVRDPADPVVEIFEDISKQYAEKFAVAF